MKYIYIVQNKHNPLAYFTTWELAEKFIEINADLCNMCIRKQRIDEPIKRMELI